MAIRISGAESAPRTVTVTATIRNKAPKPKPAIVHEPEILPPVRTASPPPVPPKPAPLSSETVKRIINKAIFGDGVPGLSIYPKVTGWIMWADGTTVAIIEHYRTAVRYQVTVCPSTFELKNFGPIDA